MVLCRPDGDCDKLESKVSTDQCLVGSSRIDHLSVCLSVYLVYKLGTWVFLM